MELAKAMERGEIEYLLEDLETELEYMKKYEAEEGLDEEEREYVKGLLIHQERLEAKLEALS